MPVNTPEATFIEAIPVLSELQVPPVVELVAVAVAPVHTVVEPPIAFGLALTVKPRVAFTPHPTEYVIVAAPAETPVTTPVDELIDALAELLLHVPPDTELDSVVVAAIHTDDEPVILPGAVRSSTVTVAGEPQVLSYVIVVEPTATPNTTPVVGFTVATATSLLVHVPPAAVLLRVVVDPVQTVVVPVIAAGLALTVMPCTAALPQPVE